MLKPYLFSDDTALLAEVASSLSGKNAIEIGCGNCYILEKITESFEVAVGTDLLRPERGKGLDIFLADGASCFREESFDVALCNPPYLPSDKLQDTAVDAGRDCELIRKLASDAMRVLKRGGKLYILLSSLSKPEDFIREWRSDGYMVNLVKERRIFFESLFVFEVVKIS